MTWNPILVRYLFLPSSNPPPISSRIGLFVKKGAMGSVIRRLPHRWPWCVGGGGPAAMRASASRCRFTYAADIQCDRTGTEEGT